MIRQRGATQDGRAAICPANRPGATAGSPTQAGGQLITLWRQFVSCPATRETGTHAAVHVPLTSRLIPLLPAPAGPARACQTVLPRSSPGAFRCARARLFLAPRPDDRPQRRWLARSAFVLLLAAAVVMIAFAGRASVAMVVVGAIGACLLVAGAYWFLAHRGVVRWLASGVVIVVPLALLAVFALHHLLWVGGGLGGAGRVGHRRRPAGADSGHPGSGDAGPRSRLPGARS